LQRAGVNVTKKERIPQFDTIRAFACLAVIFLHVVSTWRDNPTYGYTYYNYSWRDAFFIMEWQKGTYYKGRK